MHDSNVYVSEPPIVKPEDYLPTIRRLMKTRIATTNIDAAFKAESRRAEILTSITSEDDVLRQVSIHRPAEAEAKLVTEE